MRLALSGFLFEDDYASQSLSMDAFTALAADAGYDGVELRRTQITPDTPAAERRRIRSVLDAHGLETVCLTPRGIPDDGPERDAFFDRYLDLCEELDCRLLKIGGDPRRLRAEADRAKHRNVALAVNNHRGGPLETIAGTERFLAETHHDNAGLLLDVMHLSLSEPWRRILDAVPAFLPKTRNILVHTLRPARDGETPSIVADDAAYVPASPDDPAALQRWDELFTVVRAAGYDGLVTVVESGRPVEEREAFARDCARSLRAMWNAASKGSPT